MKSASSASGIVVQAFGNLLHVRFEGNIRQGEVASILVGGETLLAEVIEIAGNIVEGAGFRRYSGNQTQYSRPL